jgi:6-pyruvoyltetrahydropterin/6-carboxytetrahydropterin synthase
MYEIEILSTFSAAHRLLDYKGKCENLHGHNYKVQAAVRAESPGSGGMVIDFGDLKKAVNSVLDNLDHKYLNELDPFKKIDPSAENLAAYIFAETAKILGNKGSMLYSITIWESDTSRATYFGTNA